MRPRWASEWSLVASFILVFTSLFLISRVHAYRARSTIEFHRKYPHRLLSEWVSVGIQGAVANPGDYRVKRGAPLSKALRKSRPRPNANLRTVDLNAPVIAPMTLVIEELSEISILVQIGQNAPQPVSLPPMSRVCDLKSKIPLADPQFFRSRRLLKDGETLVISTN